MNPCNDLNVLRFLNDELSGKEMELFRAHLENCADCRTRLRVERWLSIRLRHTRPLYTAPSELRLRISRMETPLASQPLSRNWWWVTASWLLNWKILIPAALILVIALLIVPGTVEKVRAANYVEVAATTHTSYFDGHLFPQIRSTSPEIVTAWFTNRLPFQLRLPNSKTAFDATSAYQLVGATLVEYGEKPVAMIMYEAPGREKISLFVASGEYAVVAGGKAIPFGALTFRYRSLANLRIITWSNHNLSYALVSSVTAPAEQSCMICHPGMLRRWVAR